MSFLYVIAVIAITTSMTLTTRAHAAPPARGDAEITARLAFIERALDREQSSVRLWYDGWLGIFGAAALVQAGIAASVNDPAARVGGIVGSVKSGVAFAFLLANPVTARTAADTLRALPADTPAARLAKLRRAEALLSMIAAEERFGASWFPRVGGAALNVGAAWVTWATTRGAMVGWLGLVSGAAVALANVQTQPTAAMRAWERYTRAGHALPARDRDPGPRLSISPAGAGFVLTASF